jgi:hypothetical protein
MRRLSSPSSRTRPHDSFPTPCLLTTPTSRCHHHRTERALSIRLDSSLINASRNQKYERRADEYPDCRPHQTGFRVRISMTMQNGLLDRPSSIFHHDSTELEKVMGLAPLVFVTKGFNTTPSSKFRSKSSSTALHRSHVKRDGKSNRSRLGTAH